MANVNTTKTNRVLPMNLQFFAEGGDETKAEDTTTTTQTTETKAEETTTAKTEEEIRAELQKEYDTKFQKEADKRVTEAIKKREKEYADKLAKEKMSEEERRKTEDDERAQAQAKKDYDLTIKGLRLDVVDAVSELGLDAGFRNLIAVEDLATITEESERKEKLTDRVKGMKALFDKEVEKAVANAKKEFLKGTTLTTGDGKKTETSKYDEFKKAGNVKGMVSEKLRQQREKSEE